MHQVRGEGDQSREVALRALALLPEPRRVKVLEGRVVWAPSVLWSLISAGAEGEAEQILQRAGRPSFSLLKLHGRRREALRLYDAGAPPASAPAEQRAVFHNIRADLLGAEGQPELVWREIEAAMRATPTRRSGSWPTSSIRTRGCSVRRCPAT